MLFAHMSLPSWRNTDALRSGDRKMLIWSLLLSGFRSWMHDAKMPIASHEITPLCWAASFSAPFTHCWNVISSPENDGGLMLYCVSRSKYELQTRLCVMP